MSELPEHLRTEGHRKALKLQAAFITDVRRELGPWSATFDDRTIWQRGVDHGPFESGAALALSLLRAWKAGEDYAAELADELGVRW